MDFKSLTFEEFAEKLGSNSNSKLLKMARGYSIVLPAGLDSKDAILRAMYDALTGTVPSPAAVEPETSSSTPAAGGGPSIRVLATVNHHRYWRCGRKFGPHWSDPIPLTDFTPEQLETLRADKNLRIQEL